VTELEPLCLELAGRIRERVVGLLGSHAQRAHAGTSSHGDVTFLLDEEAEAELSSFVAASPIPLAVHSEDRGLVGETRERGLGGVEKPEWLLVVDPIDGTRPALAGFEAACVSVALARNTPSPTLGDVEVGVVVELKSGARFSARRGAGVRADDELAPSANEDLDRLFWASGYRGRPAMLLTSLLEPLIDRSSVGGGFFDLGSASYILTRLVTGQLDAYVDPGPRLVADVTGAAEDFRRVGGGRILCNQPYDIAAAALIVSELGLPITDAWGRPLDDAPLLGTGDDTLVSTLAAANAALHEGILDALEVRFQELQARG
jgi:Archaeal fructose-1,6-bisphosphatase and related enzymes of inositol monophosphatase family